ncbi:MAG: SDR family NAD(P)-dependent oxidoreductase [Candidatus Dadabacteria bacterium]|nr:MAG: SDR family NAD(P)-dependent oxidoreductase [Candidatus Dadabacteria bacterium]
MNHATIWITGASSGIGEAFAREAEAAGATRLILSARREDALEQVRAGMQRPDDHRVVQLDLADTDALGPLAEQVWHEHGPIDIIVHSGGITQRSLAKDTTFDVYRRIIDVDFLGTVALTQALLPHMLERDHGHIVMISSLVGKFGTPLRSAYAAAKHALHGYADAVRAELADTGVHVTVFCPGFIRTNISVNALLEDGTPQGRDDPAIINGKDPADCARAIRKAIEKNRGEAYFAGKEMLGVYLKRFTPRLFEKIIPRLPVR